jgi:hypothetical protein
VGGSVSSSKKVMKRGKETEKEERKKKPKSVDRAKEFQT